MVKCLKWHEYAPSNFSITFVVSIREGGKRKKNSFKKKQNGIVRLTDTSDSKFES